MLIGVSLLIIMFLVVFSMILGNSPLGNIINIAIDNESLVDGVPVTYIVEGADVLFYIDTTVLVIAGISLITAILISAGITGIQVLGSGLSSSSVRIIILLTGYSGLWFALSILAFNLIITIEVFGGIIYILLTTGYAIGVIQKISGSE